MEVCAHDVSNTLSCRSNSVIFTWFWKIQGLSVEDVTYCIERPGACDDISDKFYWPTMWSDFRKGNYKNYDGGQNDIKFSGNLNGFLY